MSHSIIDTLEFGDALNRYGPTAARPKPKETLMLDSKTIDIHAHVAIPAAGQYMQPFIDMDNIALAKYNIAETRELNAEQDNNRGVAITDFDDRLRVLDAQGIDIQVITPAPLQCYYNSPIEKCVKGSRISITGLLDRLQA